MITQENLKECFDLLIKREIDQTMESNMDYVIFEVHIFNTGATASLKPSEYDEELHEEVTENGNLFIEKDDFLRLYKESGSSNPHLKEYL